MPPRSERMSPAMPLVFLLLVSSLAMVAGCTGNGTKSAGLDAAFPATASPATRVGPSSTPTVPPGALTAPWEAPTASSTPAPDVAPAATAAVHQGQVLSLGPGLHDFTLPDAHGGLVTLSQYLGQKTVVLTFYRAWW